MKRDSRVPLIVAIVLLLLPVLYVGSYFALVVPSGMTLNPFSPKSIEVVHYRFCAHASALLFFPLELIDRKMRPGAWNTVPVKRNYYGTNSD